MDKSYENFKYTDISEKVIQQAYFVFNALGFGFLEKIYENALLKRLKSEGLETYQQKSIKVYFEDEPIGEYYADLVVENKVIVEVKSVEKLSKIHEVQLVNYLKASEIEVGLLINFGKSIEIKRKVFSERKR